MFQVYRNLARWPLPKAPQTCRQLHGLWVVETKGNPETVPATREATQSSPSPRAKETLGIASSPRRTCLPDPGARFSRETQTLPAEGALAPQPQHGSQSRPPTEPAGQGHQPAQCRVNRGSARGKGRGGPEGRDLRDTCVPRQEEWRRRENGRKTGETPKNDFLTRGGLRKGLGGQPRWVRMQTGEEGRWDRTVTFQGQLQWKQEQRSNCEVLS